jgi:hypothetical protein
MEDIRLDNLEDRLSSIEQRLLNLEKAQILRETHYADEVQDIIDDSASRTTAANDEEKEIESRIGRVGLAWLGNIVLLLAVIFFTEYLTTIGQRLSSVIIGACSVGAMFLISSYLKSSNTQLSLMLKVSSNLILFYEILRLHFFSAEPFVPDKTFVLTLLFLTVLLQIYTALHTKSAVFGFLAVFFSLFTAIISDSTYILLPLITITAAGTIALYYKFDWQFLLTASIVLIYSSFFIWLFGNPVMGNQIGMLDKPEGGHLFLFALGATFSFLPFLRKKDESNSDLITALIILNGIFFTLLLAIMSMKYFKDNYVGLFSVISFFCLAYSIALRSYSDWKFASAFYSLYGFLAMSISLFGIVKLPELYLLLAVQSLIVVSMALWFRNKLIIVMNIMLFITILLAYLFTSKSVNAVNFSFAIVPLISARLINWKKARLNIKTDFMRNTYIIVGFLLILFSLYNSMPGKFVTISWTIAALTYFLLSFFLKNKKYRYMALTIMIFSTFYFFIIDLARIEIIYRVLALLFLAMVSIGISIFYTNRLRNRSNDKV